MNEKKEYWLVAREYAGLSEAGGVKNVVNALANGFQKMHWDVTVFIPLYGCSAISCVEDFDIIDKVKAEILIGKTQYNVVFACGYFNGIKIIFIVNAIFTSKMGVYTYTRLEEALNEKLKSGEGHIDANIISLLFQKSVIEYGNSIGRAPDIFHCQDAHTALIPFLVNKNKRSKSTYGNTKFFITIHNAGCVYRDQLESIESASELLHLDKAEFVNNSIFGKPEPFLLSQNYAQYTTVSPWYAQELLDPHNEFCSDISKELYKRKFTITGITNGIDFNHYNPANKRVSKLPITFNIPKGSLKGKYKCRDAFLKMYSKVHLCNEEKKLDRVFQHGTISQIKKGDTDLKPVYFAFHARLVHQKGIDILMEASEIVLSKRINAHFIIMGQGTKEFELGNIALTEKYPGKYIYFQGYDKSLSRLCIAASDFLVLPSFFEPCGLQDFIGQIYGTIPVAHASGGLQKILHEKTGFLYSPNNAQTLAAYLINLIDKKLSDTDYFEKMMITSANYIQSEYSWEKIILEKYIPLFL